MSGWRKYSRPATQIRSAADAIPLPARLGALAGTTTAHPYDSYVLGFGASQCGACFGWPDDVRHGGRRG